MNSQHCIEVCNRLLRGERSAVETYDLAIEKNACSPALADLASIRRDHADSVATLMENVRSMGGVPEEESGAWGVFAQGVQGTADTFGESTALESLQVGEKSGQHDYKAALEDQHVLPACKDLIRFHLLPRIEKHISTLDHLRRAA